MRRPAWGWVVGLTAGMAAALALLPSGPAETALASVGVTLAAAAATGAALLRARQPGPQGTAWRLLALGLAAFLAGEAYWTWADLGGSTLPAASAVDAAYYAGYALLLAALVAFLPRHDGPRGRLRRAADALAVSTAATAILWIAFLDRWADGQGVPEFDAVVAGAYPALDLALAAAFALLAFEARGGLGHRLRLVAAGCLLWTASDLAYAWQALSGSFHTGSAFDAGWFGGYAAWAFAAAVPSPRERPAGHPSAGRAAAWMIYGPVGLLLPLATSDYLRTQRMEPPLFALGVALVALLGLRQVLLSSDLVREGRRLERNTRLLEDTQAVAHVGSWEYDFATQAASWSAEMHRLFGQDPATFRPTLPAILAAMPPEDAARVERELRRAAEEGVPFSVDHRVLLPGGRTRWIHAQCEIAYDGRRPLRALGVAQDITERRAADEALRASAERFRLATRATRDVVWDLDVATNRVQFSPMLKEVFGLDGGVEADAQRLFYDRVHPDDLSLLAPLMQEILQGDRSSLTFEFRFRHADGTYRHVSDHAFIQRDAAGRPVRIVGAMRDITDRKRAEEALRASEAQRTAVLSAIPDLVFVFDARRRFTQYFAGPGNGPFVPPEAFLGRTAADVLPPGVGTRIDEAVGRTLATGLPQEVAYQLPSADGPRQYEARLAPASDGTVVALARDVTARREAERALRQSQALLATAESIAGMCSWEYDLATGRASWSPSAFRLFGLPADAPMTFESWLACVHPDDREAAREVAPSVMRTGQPVEFDCRIVRRSDGAVRHTHNRTVPTLLDGNVVRITGVSHDVTEARLAQERLVAKEAEAARLTEVAAFKTQFLNSAAHELATPLTPLKLQMASLRRSHFGDLTPRQLEAVGLLDRNVERLNLLVQDLLDAARLQGGRLKLATRPLALAPVVADVVASFSEKARQDGVQLAVRGLESGADVVGDEARLTQVLFNLVHNALKFTPRGGRVELALSRDGGQAVLAVRDSGIGLAAEQIGRLFQPFTQVHDPAQHNVGGTGLGLYISRGILEQHGGTLACRSDGPGHGATFEVRLPLARAEAAAPAAARALA